MKQSKLLFGFVFFLMTSMVFTSCSDGASQEIIIDVEMEGLLVQKARNPNNSEFLKVLEATRNIHSKKGGDLISIFFNQSGKMFPSQRFVMYFHFNSDINVSSTNVEVISYFMKERQKCLNIVVESLAVRLAESQVAHSESIKGEDRIKIHLGKGLDKKELAKLIETQGRIEFHETYTHVELSSSWVNLNNLITGETLGETATMNQILFDSHSCFVSSENKKEVDLLLNQKEVVSLFPPNLKFVWSSKEIDSKRWGVKGYKLYATKVLKDGGAQVGGADILKASVAYNSDAGNAGVDYITASTLHGGNDGNPIVEIVMNQEGEVKWRRMTAANVGKMIAITIDETVVSAPYVNETIWAGRTEISGRFTTEEAQELATHITIGTLPVICKIRKIEKL